MIGTSATETLLGVSFFDIRGKQIVEKKRSIFREGSLRYLYVKLAGRVMHRVKEAMGIVVVALRLGITGFKIKTKKKKRVKEKEKDYGKKRGFN